MVDAAGKGVTQNGVRIAVRSKKNCKEKNSNEKSNEEKIAWISGKGGTSVPAFFISRTVSFSSPICNANGHPGLLTLLSRLLLN